MGRRVWPQLVGVWHQGNMWKHFRRAGNGLSSLLPGSSPFQGTHIAMISLEVHSEWRAHCFGLPCLSLSLIDTRVLSYVVIALIANICWLLTMCHCAKRFIHITSLPLLQPYEVLLRSSQKWENGGVGSCALPRGVWAVSGTAGIWTHICSPPNHPFLTYCAICTASEMSA